MARTKIGDKGGFLDDRQFVDFLKVSVFMGVFFGTLRALEKREITLAALTKEFMYLLTLPRKTFQGVKGIIGAIDNATGIVEASLNLASAGVDAAGEVLTEVAEKIDDVTEVVEDTTEDISDFVDNPPEVIIENIKEKNAEAVTRIRALECSRLQGQYKLAKRNYDKMSKWNPLRIGLYARMQELKTRMKLIPGCKGV